ncbi:TPA: flagellar export protein FliJ [Legionella pneumophila]|uniref:Flagellar FliJ protein n=1 Tax=Legionella pneumophila subsp. pneumophila TaxID=91891 RepID=A0A3A6UV97_LEGPN|nr:MULTISPECIES: flagellar export protein FliJ [Legionella]ERH43562.1 flagellar biosynthesis protein FliJ [Legionella pneumophila str. Leg01/53]ERH45774.1 flagellar biosynthesis protein FliJ [Legionella pneumophila str. Leg01/11]ERI48961.1 flagellar biosynthesis protein FliJ [Legionella pneumophila str. Leg01/20]AMQ28029.1 flagellar biosynthesis protein FliJ [Legionella pneumophila subsp. pneumophila]ANN95770.1 flagellar export protein FliJ [Legionella pneumophila]
MSDRLDRLIQLLKIKQEATQQAYIELVKAREQFNQNKARHEQLVGYRQDYLQQLEVLGQQGSYVGPLRNRINFINHLDTALVQLNSYLSQLAKNRMKADLNYKQAKTSEEGINKLIERVKRTELKQLQRIEQKETDEYAQKQWYSSLKHDR